MVLFLRVSPSDQQCMSQAQDRSGLLLLPPANYWVLPRSAYFQRQKHEWRFEIFVLISYLCYLLQKVVVGDMVPSRLEAAKKFGCFTLDLSKLNDVSEIPAALKQMIGSDEVDHAIDCVGFEARGCGHAHHQVEQPAAVLNTCMSITRAGGGIGIPGLYVTADPGAVDAAAKKGSLSLRLGLGWAKSLTFATGQTPVMHYHRRLYKAIMFDKIQIAKAVNAQVISLDEAPAAYAEFDKGAAKKFIIG